MESKTLKTVAIAALVFAIGGLSLGFAALSQVLTIDTSSTVQSSGTSWDVHFANADEGVVTGDATKGNISLDTTSVTLNGVILKAPGDSVKYTFDVVNAGELDAKIGTYEFKTPEFTGSGEGAEADETLVETNYTYTLTYENDGQAVKQDDTLAASETKTIVLTVTYSGSADSLPTNSVSVSNSGATLTYVQA